MRLALAAWEALHALPIGGVAVHVSSLASAFARRGHSVHLFTRRGPGQSLRDRIGGVVYHRCPFEPRPSFIDETVAFAEPLAHYLEAEEDQGGPFDWVQAHDWPAFPAALTIAARSGRAARPRRWAAAFHSTEWGRAGRWPEGGVSLRIAGFEREACRTAAAITALSGAVRRELTALYHPPDWKSETVHQGVDAAIFADGDFDAADAAAVKAAHGLSPAAPLALFVGRLDAARGADRLPGIWARVAGARPDARLLVVGEGPLAADLRRESPASIRFAGWRDGAELASLYRSSAVLLSPGRRDPYGQVVLLSWSAGRPAAATREGAAGEFILPGVNGWLADDEAGLASALLEAFADPSRTDWLGANGRTAVETAFTWDRLAERTERLFARSMAMTATMAMT